MVSVPRNSRHGDKDINPITTYAGDGNEESESSTSGSGGIEFDKSVSGSRVTTSNDSGDSSDDGDKDDIKKRISNQETKKVARLRYLVLAVLLCSAAAVCTTTYILSRNAEQEAYTTQYDGSSAKIVASFESLHDRLGIVNMIGIAATDFGLMYNGSMSDFSDATIVTKWPFLTVPHFHQTAATVRSLSGALYISISPLVKESQRTEWEEWVTLPQSKSWISDGFAYQEQTKENGFEYEPPPLEDVTMTNRTSQSIFYYTNYSSNILRNDDEEIVDDGQLSGSYLPTWQANPILMKQRVNENILRRQSSGSVLTCLDNQDVAFGPLEVTPAGAANSSSQPAAFVATLRSVQDKKAHKHSGSPVVTVSIPIFDTFMNEKRRVIGVLSVTTSFRRIYFDKVLPDTVIGMIAVVKNTCGGEYTYQVDGPVAKGLNFSDVHDSRYNSQKRASEIYGKDVKMQDGSVNGTGFDESCQYYVEAYPSQTFEDEYVTPLPLYVTLAVAGVFLITIIVFFLFNRLVERRQHVVLEKAAHSTAIVSSLFPKQVRDRLLETDEQRQKQIGSGNRLKMILAGGDTGDSHLNGSQIADLFPDCTVLFADIVGFTAWSSTRAPEHVFILLQTIYQGYDQIARRRKVFKVETIGDCYLAATGLPDAQPAHATIMARFASECKQRMSEMTSELEASLGPDCSDLKMRFGMHSGPVTAGVLMGDRARFQLFGDTVNTAARMESTGLKDKIHISQATADLLIAAGKPNWVRPREDAVEAKGKGILKTYWLSTHASAKTASVSGSNSNSGESNTEVNTKCYDEDAGNYIKRERLIDWVVDLLADQIKKVIIKNETMGQFGSTSSVVPYIPQAGEICLDEVREVIRISKFDETITTPEMNVSAFEMNSEALRQLRDYVRLIAAMYHTNPFHNFEHACHVTLSVSKLLNRIVAPDLSAEDSKRLKGSGDKGLKAHLHASTYGIYSDPLAQFAIVFSALIHDVDHRGCSNAQLVKEEVNMGERYKNKSVAEQNSLDLSWNVLMSDQFDTLRKTIFGSQDELFRFRQIIVNSVLATDIFDKELNDLRKLRWTKAFSGTHADDEDDLDRKATIVMEHIIQASDVSHTMQHWHVYQRWNQMLFKEMYQAYRAGRMAVDPSTFWYKGEMCFYDNYVIPLAKKLKECNVFGVSSDEYLNYAVGNRYEWEHKGEALVAEVIRQVTEDLSIHI